jgi:hypothetical protein
MQIREIFIKNHHNSQKKVFRKMLQTKKDNPVYMVQPIQRAPAPPDHKVFSDVEASLLQQLLGKRQMSKRRTN